MTPRYRSNALSAVLAGRSLDSAMIGEVHSGRPGLPARGAELVAGWEVLPTSIRAILGYYSDTGVFDYSALTIKRSVDETFEEILSDAYEAIDAAIASEFDRDPDSVGFSYDTKLTMPAKLTMGHVYQRAMAETPDAFDPVTGEASTSLLDYLGNPFGGAPRRQRARTYRARYAETIAEIERAEEMTVLIVEALLDGDMRDALNDAEFQDFEVDFPTDETSRRRVAEVAQACLEARVTRAFARHPSGVHEAYEHAVDVSEAHQERDPRFREFARLAIEGSPEAADHIRAEYKHAPFDDAPPLFSPAELDLPYLKTQYGRIGVIYRGMIEMYRAAGIEIDADFEKSIVLAIIGAQIWLDDIDDYERDVAGEQLTPVTAEYWLADSDAEAYERIVDITMQYLDTAKRYAAESNSTLTGIGIDYIFRSADPASLPGSGVENQ